MALLHSGSNAIYSPPGFGRGRHLSVPSGHKVRITRHHPSGKHTKAVFGLIKVFTQLIAVQPAGISSAPPYDAATNMFPFTSTEIERGLPKAPLLPPHCTGLA